MVRRPPDLAAEAVAAPAQRLDDRREQQCLSDRDDLWLEALLRPLRPKRREIRRAQFAGDDFRAGRLERRNLRREIAVHELVTAGIVQLVASLCQCRRKLADRVTSR